MNLIDKIIDRLDALDKFKERVYIWYNYKDTQVALAIILFLVLIGTVLYFIFDVGLPWYWSLIFVCSLCIGILYLIVRYTRNKRDQVQNLGFYWNQQQLLCLFKDCCQSNQEELFLCRHC